MYFASTDVRFIRDELFVRSFIEDENMNNELVTSYRLDEENTRKLLTLIHAPEESREAAVYEAVRSGSQLECFCLENGLAFTWSRRWENHVPGLLPTEGTEKDCLAAERWRDCFR